MPRDLSTRLARAGRLSLIFEPRDVWLGVYWSPTAVFVCLVPCLPIRWERRPRLAPVSTATEGTRHARH